jgi:beta-ureidopropionase / N-carbamoyl-L-amino-acid hydrolase
VSGAARIVPLTLAQLNAAAPADVASLLAGTYENSPWIAERAASQRPYASLAQLKHVLADVVQAASREEQLALILAHPELAGREAAEATLTAESTNEQQQAGLDRCTPDEMAQIGRLNAAYRARFGFPFVLAVRGPRGTGLDKRQILATFARRLGNPVAFEHDEALRNIHRIAEIRLADRFGAQPLVGREVWDWHAALARHSDAGSGELTVTYLTDAHRACATEIAASMRDSGFDTVTIDAVGNVVGVYFDASLGADVDAKRLLTGSHYDTVRNAGRYDGRLGIYVPIACVRALHRAERRLPFGVEVVAFAEEEGQRYKATFLGSGALVGQFDARWLDQRDADGTPMREAMATAGLDPAGIASVVRDPSRYLGFVEVHIEQGPVLNARLLPLGVVTSINGSVRFVGEFTGMASHAGTTPMDHRRDAATGAAELALYLERRAAQEPDLVGTMGMLAVPNGSINVVPGRCAFSLDIRATTDAVRNACEADVLTELARIAGRRGLGVALEETMRAAAAPSDPAWQARWEHAVAATGLPVLRLSSGAGHDAMKLHEVMPQAMLFVRGENAGISHNPLESTTADDIELAVEVFGRLLEGVAAETPP